MVLPVDPVAVATVSYKIAAAAWTTFKNALHFSEDADDLILRLDIEQARFYLWSCNAGYEKEKESLNPALLPVAELITRILKHLTALFEGVDDLRIRYGLTDDDTVVDEPKKLHRCLSNLNKTLHAAGIKTTPAPDVDEDGVPPTLHRTSTLRKLRWGIRDKVRFQGLVEAVETYVSKLGQLLTDPQQKNLAEDRTRLNTVIVGNVKDAATLQVVKSAARAGIQDIPIDNLCQRLALSDRMPNTNSSVTMSQFSLPINDFPGLGDILSASTIRGLTRRSSIPDAVVLVEKKVYPTDISQEEFSLLSDRIGRIVLLLRVQRNDLRTLRCIGYIHDSRARCWWIAFDYPTSIQGTMSSQAPVSLLDLVMEDSFPMPALEARLILASNLAGSLFGLFNSSWLHKSIRSENIVFPSLSTLCSGTRLDVPDVASPYLTGFEYSRKHMERSLGKPWSRDINRAMYRHPFYQGQNPGSYCIQYDMYSFGLILVEIARWMPLASFLPEEFKTPKATNSNAPPNFNEDTAKRVQRRVLSFVDKEMAFRVGTPYRDAARWCLTQADEKIQGQIQQVLEHGVLAPAEADERPALDFYNNVVVLLERLAVGICVR